MATIAETMVSALETAIQQNPLVASVRMPDGTSVSYGSIQDRITALAYWTRKLKVERGEIPVVSTPDMGAAW